MMIPIWNKKFPLNKNVFKWFLALDIGMQMSKNNFPHSTHLLGTINAI